jgi:photosystem II stability/assembly factor-like uncharacterized protein
LGQAHPSGVLYIADDGQLMSSTDAGDTWRRIESPDPTNAIHDLRHIAIDPTDNDVLYLPLRNNGIVKSTDSGRTWKTVNDGLVNTQIGFITTHPADPAALYAGSAVDLRTFRSLDYGSSWTLLDGAGTEHSATQRVDELRLDPKHPDTIYRVVDTAGAFRSDDAGGTWSTTWPHFRFSSIYSLATAPTYPSILYAGKSGYGLFRSDDRGNTWRFLPQSGVDVTYALAVHPENGDFVLSGDAQKPPGTAAELHRSRDGGATWDVPLTVPNATGITSVAFDPRVELVFRQGAQPDDPTRLYAASAGPRGRLWFSNDAGDSWKPLNDDLNFTNVQALAVVPHRPGVAYAGLWGGGTWRTEDGGLNWHRLSGDPAMSAVAIAVDPSNHNVVYIADGTTPHLYRSTDDGNTWELLFDAGADYDRIAALALAPSDPSILYVSVARATHHPANGAVFRVDTSAPIGENASDITGDLPGIASSLAVHRRDPRRAFATVADHGVWKTSDDGTSWQQVKSGLPDVDFSGIVADPVHAETLFVTGGYDLFNTLSQHTSHDADQKHGIWKSTDDGNTWVRLGGSTFGQASGPINAIAFHPKDDQVMYAAGETGIFLSPDQGETWTNISGRLPAVPMSAVATDGEALYAGSVGAGVFPGIIYPLINTADWSSESLLSAPVAHIQITLHPDDSQTLYASAYPGGVFKTTDGGTTWSAHNRDLPSFSAADASRQGHYALAVSPSAPDVLYLGLYAQGIFRSDDGAETWRPVFGEDGELQHATVQTLLVHPDDAEIVYVATEEGVWRTVNGARTWSNYGAGLPGAGDVRSLVRGVDDQLYGGSRGYGLYTRSAFHQTGEDTWRQLSEMGNWGTPSLAWDERPLYQHTSLLLLAGDSNTLYAGTFPSGVYKTIDGGTAWREQNAGLQTDGVLSLVSNPAEHQILYAGTSSGISRSIDGATTWHAWDAGWPPQQRVSSIVVDPTNPDTLYASSKGSTNPERDGGTVMKSTDGGATWFPITVGLGSDLEFHTILLDRFDPNIVYLATQSDGVFISRDGGATWSSWNEGLWNRVTGSDHHFVKDILQLSADGRLLYLGTSGSGVWRRPAVGAP